MKTIYVALGVAVLAGGAAIMLGGSGGGGACERVELDDVAVGRIEAAMPKLVRNLTPDSSGLEFVRSMFRSGFPTCTFANSDPTVIGYGSGDVSWPSVVASARGKTLLELSADPTFLNLFAGVVPGREGAGSMDTSLVFQQLIRSLVQSVSTTLVPIVPANADGSPGAYSATDHYWAFTNAEHMGEYGGNKIIWTQKQGDGSWRARVREDEHYDNLIASASAPTEPAALNKVRLAAYYGAP